eukprot:14671551-Alexandrium_andersonii.AAC.1
MHTRRGTAWRSRACARACADSLRGPQPHAHCHWAVEPMQSRAMDSRQLGAAGSLQPGAAGPLQPRAGQASMLRDPRASPQQPRHDAITKHQDL